MTGSKATAAVPDAGAPVSRFTRAMRWWLFIYLLSALAVAVQRTLFTPENNFLILRTSSQHLLTGQDLYAAYPAIYRDFFKYSPTFAFLWAPFALFPPVPGYMLWAVACVSALFAGIVRALPPSQAVLALALSWLAVFGDLQRSQSNALCAGLMIFAWAGFELGQQWRPAIAIAAGTFVKLFPVTAVVLAVFHRRTLRFAFVFLAVIAMGAALPLLVTSPAHLAMQYRSWFAIEMRDAAPLPRYGTGGADLYAGLMGQFRVWWGVRWPNWPSQLVGVLVLLAPVAIRRSWWQRRQFRVLFLASTLVFCVLFNHQSESPSYSIAIIGASIWYAVSERTWWRTVLIVACILIVNVASTDVMPRTWYREWYVPYLVKTIPLIPLWIVMQLELLGALSNRGVLERAEPDELHVAAPEALAQGR